MRQAVRLGIVTLGTIMMVLLGQSSGVPKPAAQYDRPTGQIVLTNARLELRIETRQGLNPRQLRDMRTGRLLADSAYVWPGGRSPKMLDPPKIASDSQGSQSITLKGQLGELVIEQSFTAPYTVNGDEITLTVPIPAKGRRLVKLRLEAR